VFGRIGLGRIGNAPALYDAVRRSHAHAAGAPHEVRSQPVRFAAFLCERVAGSQMSQRLLGREQYGDDGRHFLVPMLKLFSGQRVGSQELTSVELKSFHLTDRLRRLFTIGELPNDGGADLNKPPFVRTTLNGGLQIKETNLGASLLIASAPQSLVREVQVSAGNSAGLVRRATTVVPPRGLGIEAFNSNRRYSTLRVGQNLFAVGLDYIASEITNAVAEARAFRSPRNCSEYINMRHEQGSPTSVVEDLNQSISSEAEFEKTLDKGGYSIVLYTDDICDGYVSAEFRGPNGYKAMAAPAFSVITAPDFFPCVGGLDISGFVNHFKDGGPSPLCEGRLRATPGLRNPDTDAVVFDKDDTVAAIVSKAPRGNSQHPAVSVAVTNSLTDGASNVFAPGWDVTYGRDGLFSSPYYHTAGLGSPFVEDAKLCASANGMWAAASPDASRTFNPKRTPTAIPLTDVELGIHPTSPAAASVGVVSGWDGEYGPCFVMHEGALAVNFADIMRADYVSNALRNMMRFDRLREVSRKEMIMRLHAFSSALKHLDGDNTVVSESQRWLVAFQRVDNWGGFSLDLLMPTDAAVPLANVAPAMAWGNDTGYVFAFVPRDLESESLINTGRRVALVTGSVAVVAWRSSDGTMVSANALI